MARKRASMREGPLAELFRKTEAAQRAQDAPAEGEQQQQPAEADALSPRARAALEATVEHVHDFDDAEEAREATAPSPAPRVSQPATTAGAERGRSLSRRSALLPDDSRACAAAAPCSSAEGNGVSGRDPRRRRRRRRAERAPPHDRRGDCAGRLHRCQHRHAGTRHLGRSHEDPHRRRRDTRSRLGCRPNGGPRCR